MSLIFLKAQFQDKVCVTSRVRIPPSTTTQQKVYALPAIRHVLPALTVTITAVRIALQANSLQV